MNHVCQHLALVNALYSIWFGPLHLAIAMHLGIHEITNEVSSIRPLKDTKTVYLRVEQFATVDENTLLPFPFLKAFAVYNALVEAASDFYLSVTHLFDSLAFDLIPVPHAFILLLIGHLTILAVAMELATLEVTGID